MEITSKFIIIKFRIIVKITNYKFTYDLGSKNRAFILKHKIWLFLFPVF